MSKTPMSEKREAEYKRDWINRHNQADELVADQETQQPIAAIYYYPPTQHIADNKKLWRMIGARMEVERLKEMKLEREQS